MTRVKLEAEIDISEAEALLLLSDLIEEVNKYEDLVGDTNCFISNKNKDEKDNKGKIQL